MHTFRSVVSFCLILTIIASIPVVSGSTTLNTGAGEGIIARATVLSGIEYPKATVMVKGLTIHPDNPLQFDFIVEPTDTPTRGHVQDRTTKNVSPSPMPSNLGLTMKAPQGNNPTLSDLKQESLKMIKYFLASITTPPEEMWVNLSPYEKNRIIPDAFGQTLMGRDLLAQDYILKQMTAALIYPDTKLGHEFWSKIYAQAKVKFGTTNIPINTFNKVWIMPDKATVWEHGHSVFVVERHLRVMLEQDYLSFQKHMNNDSLPLVGRVREGENIGNSPPPNLPHQGGGINSLASQIIRDIIIPALEHEINHGDHFAQLRQIYNAMILATWYKKRLKDSLLGTVYMNKNKVAGVGWGSVIASPKGEAISKRTTNAIEISSSLKSSPRNDAPEDIYQQYLKTFKKGVFNIIKEEPDPATGEMIPRKYFSGGAVGLDSAQLTILNGPKSGLAAIAQASLPTDKAMKVTFNAKPDAAIQRPIWDRPIQRMLDKGYRFLPLMMNEQQYVYRGIRGGIINGLITGQFNAQQTTTPSTRKDDSEKTLGIFYVSHTLWDAKIFIHDQYEKGVDAGILILPGSTFNEEVQNGRAAVHVNKDGLYRFPFFSRSISTNRVPYIVVNPGFKKYLDEVKTAGRALNPKEQRLHQTLNSLGAPKILAMPEEISDEPGMIEHLNTMTGIKFTYNSRMETNIYPTVTTKPTPNPVMQVSSDHEAKGEGSWVDTATMKQVREELFGESPWAKALSPAAQEQIRSLFTESMFQGWRIKNKDEIPVEVVRPGEVSGPHISVWKEGHSISAAFYAKLQMYKLELTADGDTLAIGVGGFGPFPEPFVEMPFKDLPSDKKLFWWIERKLTPFAKRMGFSQISLINRTGIPREIFDNLGYKAQGKDSASGFDKWTKELSLFNQVTIISDRAMGALDEAKSGLINASRYYSIRVNMLSRMASPDRVKALLYYLLFQAIDKFLKAVNQGQVQYIYPFPGPDVIPNMFSPTYRINIDPGDFMVGKQTVEILLKDQGSFNFLSVEQQEQAANLRDAMDIESYVTAINKTTPGKRVLILKNFNWGNKSSYDNEMALLNKIFDLLEQGDKVLVLSAIHLIRKEIGEQQGLMGVSGFTREYEMIGSLMPLSFFCDTRVLLLPSSVVLFEKTGRTIHSKSFQAASKPSQLFSNPAMQPSPEAIKAASPVLAKSTIGDQAQVAQEVGGIDMNAGLLDLAIKRDALGMPLPANRQDWVKANINGLEPVIIKMDSVNLRELIGVDTR